MLTPREIIRKVAADLRRKPEWRDAWEAAAPDRRDAIDDAVVYKVLRVGGPYLSGKPSLDVAASLILGATPKSLAPCLTRHEAAEWANQEVHENPRIWLWHKMRLQYTELPEEAPEFYLVIRWVAEVMNDPERRAAATRSRTGRIGEDEVEGSCLERLDEITPADLRRSPVETMEITSQRLAEAMWEGPNELSPHMEWHDRLPEGVTVIRHFNELYKEGRECRHCVATYASNIANGSAVILRVKATDGKRSTAMVEHGTVTQHRGPRNEEPAPSCVELVKRCSPLLNKR